MTADYIVLGPVELALAAGLVVLTGLLALVLRLGVAGRLFIAAVRATAQLAVMALVLKALFEMASPWLTALAVAVMLGFAGREAAARQGHKFAGWWTLGLGTSAMTVAGLLVTLFALTAQIKADPWYDPAYALPLLGMILGNAMNGVSLALDRLSGEVIRERPAIEARLALGHDRWQALAGPVRAAAGAGLIPVVNAMSAMGLVFIPGMMTGQLLAGVPPTQAVRYQLMIVFLIAAGTALGVLAVTLAAAARLTDGRHRLRLDRLRGDTGV